MSTFEYSTEGFNMISDNNNDLTRWADIEAIFAYKLDLITIDEIKMDIFTKDEYRISLTEEHPHWNQFIEKLKEMFPSIDQYFDMKVMFPPFATNFTLVYDSLGRTLEEAEKMYYSP